MNAQQFLIHKNPALNEMFKPNHRDSVIWNNITIMMEEYATYKTKNT